MRTVFSTALLLIVSILVNKAFAEAQVLASVGETKITAEDFQRKYEQVKMQAPHAVPTPEQYLEDLVRYEMGLQEAAKMKLANDPLVKERYEQILYNSLLEKQLGESVDKVKVTESEMQAYYNKNPEIRIAHILVAMKPDPKPVEKELARKRAIEISGEVKKSKKPFDDFVKEFSDDGATKDVGGDIGFQSRMTLVASIYDTALKMKEGEIKGPLETQFGFHIIKFLEKRKYDMADKQQVRAAVLMTKRTGVVESYFNRLKKNYRVQVDKDALKKMTN